jgi:hypothetical protein
MAPTLADLAATLGTTTARLESILAAAAARVPRASYYVFRVPRRDQPDESIAATRRTRTVVAFPSADDALAWAQRMRQGEQARVRSIATSELLGRMLADSAIGAARFRQGGADGRLRPYIEISRDELLRAIDQPDQSIAAEEQVTAESPADTSDRDESSRDGEDRARESAPLTAERYDGFQFGVDFGDRARFRVALAEAIERVVVTYEPPPGSVDQGPRSIYAASAVEQWLRENGFPRARQRRWIDIADDPRWGNAVELCEIDAGTDNHLLVQLLIDVDARGRQYIRDVLVSI